MRTDKLPIEDIMTASTTQTLAAELLDAWNAHDIDRIMTYYSAHVEGQDIAQAEPIHGRDDMRQNIARYLTAFPDLCVTVIDSVGQPDRIVLVWLAQATHGGTMLNIPPTGRLVSVRGITILTIESGLITREISVWDLAGLLRSFGLLPDL